MAQLIQNPGNSGFFIEHDEGVMLNRDGVTVTTGDVFALEVTAATIDSVTGLPIAMDQAASVDLNNSIAAVCLEDVAAISDTRWGFRGFYPCLVTGTIAVGDPLRLTLSQDYLTIATAASSDKVVAYAMEVQASGTGIIKCLFDGLGGFGQA